MTDRKTPRAHITSEKVATVPVGRGFVDFQPGWSGPVVPEVADYLELHGLAEVWRDGEPPVVQHHPAQEETTDIRVIQTPDGPRFEPLDDGDEPEPPAFDGGSEGEGL